MRVIGDMCAQKLILLIDLQLTHVHAKLMQTPPGRQYVFEP